jgi:translation initiation factor 2 alpha subunit (eIF-2alpha)
MSTNPEAVFDKIEIDPLERTALEKSVKAKMAPHDVKIRAEFKLSCWTKSGVDAIKQALIEAKKAVNEENL